MSIIFVLGGARSGKSRFAESLCQAPRTYIATAQAFDEEMIKRIAQHQSDRGKEWHTLEAPLDLVGALVKAKGDVLLDCLTLWLNNLLLAEKDVQASLDGLLAQLQINRQKLVIVSNELGLGLVPEHGLSRRFRDLHGLMNQQVAAIADCVVFTIAGIPQVIKGQLPEPPQGR
ncbi:MAG: bifunctional adenosylcobinamide kinase/adenosylcobinamide-phosphate guanylyltransferase [Pseudomonadota bacterium]|nr:bifunctional adenosylcobinamide kinase/adenosylcobinamide-phosphate guanylyltransferase [Pseudomonadota bacterium]